MPSKLDPHLATIESWVAAEAQITALGIVRRLAAVEPAEFSDKQYSIVQRLIRSLRRKAAKAVLFEPQRSKRTSPTTVRPGPVEGASCGGHSPRPQAL